MKTTLMVFGLFLSCGGAPFTWAQAPVEAQAGKVSLSRILQGIETLGRLHDEVTAQATRAEVEVGKEAVKRLRQGAEDLRRVFAERDGLILLTAPSVIGIGIAGRMIEDLEVIREAFDKAGTGTSSGEAKDGVAAANRTSKELKDLIAVVKSDGSTFQGAKGETLGGHMRNEAGEWIDDKGRRMAFSITQDHSFKERIIRTISGAERVGGALKSQ